jgi:hypothetical protein
MENNMTFKVPSAEARLQSQGDPMLFVVHNVALGKYFAEYDYVTFTQLLSVHHSCVFLYRHQHHNDDDHGGGGGGGGGGGNGGCGGGAIPQQYASS